MKQRFLKHFAATFLLLASPLSAQDKLYLAATETDALMAKEGQKVIVHGEVAGSGKSDSGTNFVNFKGAVFFLVTFKSDLVQFPDGEPAERYEGKRIAVEGSISVYQGKPQIKLVDPAQIEILEPDAVFPPPMAESTEPEKPTEKSQGETAAPTSKAGPEEPKRKPPVDPSDYFKKKG